jgi:hypothetical protein
VLFSFILAVAASTAPVANGIALLPVRCERDFDPALCRTLGDSVALELSHKIDAHVVTPEDLQVLFGAQGVQELSSCEGADCFRRQDLLRVDARYIVSLSAGRIGDEARLLVRLVDLSDGAIVEREEARRRFSDEKGIEASARNLVFTAVRHHMNAKGPVGSENLTSSSGVSPLVVAGVASLALAVVSGATGAVLGTLSYTGAQTLRDGAAGRAPADVEKDAQSNLQLAQLSDGASAVAVLLGVVGAALCIGGAL